LLEATNKQQSQYVQCMAGRGFSVSGLPETYEANVVPSPSISPPLSSPSHGKFLTADEKKELGHIIFTAGVASGGVCYLTDREHILRCTVVDTIKEAGIEAAHEGMAKDIIYTFICGNKDAIHQIVERVLKHLRENIRNTLLDLEDDMYSYVQCTA
jgi:hypothetical protein